jgi:hypothetical protein
VTAGFQKLSGQERLVLQSFSEGILTMPTIALKGHLSSKEVYSVLRSLVQKGFVINDMPWRLSTSGMRCLKNLNSSDYDNV